MDGNVRTNEPWSLALILVEGAASNVGEAAELLDRVDAQQHLALEGKRLQAELGILAAQVRRAHLKPH